MHVARRKLCTSATARMAAQTLYKPYKPLVSSKAKSVTRRKAVMSEPAYHKRLDKDCERLVDHLRTARSLDEEAKRAALVARVTAAVKAEFGDQYDVDDVSMHTYATDITGSPLELVVVDKDHPIGFERGIPNPLPPVYDHEKLAKALSKHGFTGSFLSPTTVWLARDGMLSYGTNTIHLPPNIPWPSYLPPMLEHPSYPIRLRCSPTDDDLTTLTVSGPSPLHAPLHDLLRSYLAFNPRSADALVLLYVWSASLRMEFVEPTVLALMLVQYLQAERNYPCLQAVDKGLRASEERDCGPFVKGEVFLPPGELQPLYPGGWGEQTVDELGRVRIDTSFSHPMKPHWKYAKTSRILREFFDYYSMSYGRFQSLLHVVSVRNGFPLERSNLKRQLEAAETENERLYRIYYLQEGKEDHPRWCPEFRPPRRWKRERIVVQDPFVLAFNHTALWKSKDFNYFAHVCNTASRRLFNGEMFSEIFGSRADRAHAGVDLGPHPVMLIIEKLFGVSIVPPATPETTRWTYFNNEIPEHQKELVRSGEIYALPRPYSAYFHWTPERLAAVPAGVDTEFLKLEDEALHKLGTAQYPGRVGNSRQGEKRAAAETEAALAELQDREAGLRDEENFGLRRAPRQPPAPHLLEGAQLDERRRAWSARYAGSPFAPTAEDTDDSSEPEPRFRPYASSAPPADGQGAFQQHDRDFETRDRQQLDPQRRGAFPPRPAGSQSPRGNSYPQGYRPTTGERPQRQGAFQQRDGDFGARDRQQFDPQRRGAFPPTPARSPSPRGNPYPQGYRPTNGGGAFGPRSQLHTLALGRRLFGTTAGLEARNRGARRAHPRFNDDDITSLEEDDDPASYELVPGDAFGTGVPMDPGLDEELWEYYYSRRPDEREERARADALAFIRRTVNNYAKKVLHSDDVFEVEPFGSTLIGVDEGKSDLDLVVLDPQFPEGYKPGVRADKLTLLSPLYDVKDMSNYFHKQRRERRSDKRGFTKLEAIPKARVPLVKGAAISAVDSLHIPFDLCINARNGLYNSRLIAAYAELHPYVRPMIVILKAWARSSGVDAPPQVINKGRKTIGVPRPFSSYILGLLVVAYLQRVHMLPNLQEPFVNPIPLVPPEVQEPEDGDIPLPPYVQPRLESDGTSPDVWWTTASDNPALRLPSDVRFLSPSSEPVQQWVQGRRAALARALKEEDTLKETLVGFFDFWSREFRFSSWAVSVRDGGIVDRLQRPPYRDPDRFIAEVTRDLQSNEQPSSPSEDTEEREREGDSLELDQRIQRELAHLLASPTNIEAWSKATFVVMDPIVRTNNVTYHASQKAVRHFVAECTRARNVMTMGLNLDDLLSRAGKGKKGKKGKKDKKGKKGKKNQEAEDGTTGKKAKKAKKGKKGSDPEVEPA